ncbi:hypothetical protein V496_04369, partial [Pseudogymnoascus sp. VKM F-4515 (FW-2607)]
MHRSFLAGSSVRLYCHRPIDKIALTAARRSTWLGTSVSVSRVAFLNPILEYWTVVLYSLSRSSPSHPHRNPPPPPSRVMPGASCHRQRPLAANSLAQPSRHPGPEVVQPARLSYNVQRSAILPIWHQHTAAQSDTSPFHRAATATKVFCAGLFIPPRAVSNRVHRSTACSTLTHACTLRHGSGGT